jgi:hypothetical protein
MSSFFDNFMTNDQKDRAALHEEGFVNMAREQISDIRKKMPGVGGRGLAAAGVILAVGAGATLGTVALAGLGGYMVGKHLLGRSGGAALRTFERENFGEQKNN